MSEASLWRLISRSMLLLVGIVLVVAFLTQLASVFVRLFLAAILGAALTPPVDATMSLVGRWRRPPPRAAVVLLFYLALVVLAVALGALVLGPVVAESRAFIERLPRYGAAALDAYHRAVDGSGVLRDLLAGVDLTQQLGSVAQQALNVADQALSLVQYLVGAAFGALNALMVLLLALYLTVDAPRIRAYLIVFLPPDRRDQAVRMIGEIAHRLGAWARGQVLLCTIIGAMSWVGLTAIGVPYGLMLALIAGVMEAVPTVGPIVSAVPAVAVALTVSPWHGAAVLVLYLVIQQLENYLIVPRVMSQAVSLHPLVVLVALMVGGELMGPTGVVLAVPLAATLAVVVDEIRRVRVAGFDEA